MRFFRLPLFVLPSTGLPTSNTFLEERGGIVGGYSWELLVGVFHPVLQILTLFDTKKWHFPHPFSDLAYAEIMLTLLKLEHQQKDFSKSFSNCHSPITLSFLFIYNWNDKYFHTFIHSRSFLETYTRLQTKMGKVCTAQKGEWVGEGEREKSAKGTRSPHPPPFPFPSIPYPLSTPAKISPAMYKPLQK